MTDESTPAASPQAAETMPVAVTQRFDEGKFAQYLLRELGARVSAVSQMTGGQSNPTFLIKTDADEYVLRKQPAGVLLPSAHAIDREFQALCALSRTDFPVPKAILFCSDAHIIGTPFYVMQRLRGRVFTDSQLPGLSAAERRRIYFSLAETLARLHRIDYREVGLERFGRPADYYLRQIERWSGQWQKSKTRENPAIDRLIAWLAQHVPPETPVAIAHGDFRLYNIMFHLTEPRVIGVLDWELATLAPSIADLTHSCLNYYLPAQYPNSLQAVDLESLGIPSEEEYLEHYFKTAGEHQRPGAFHKAFALFRLAVIVEGILARAHAGTAANPRAQEAGRRGIEIANQGWLLAGG